MGWRFSCDVGAYAAAAGPLLAERPVANTVSLTVLENALVRASDAGPPELYGWFVDGAGRVRGAVSHTPRFELLIGELPEATDAALVAGLQGATRALPGVNGPARAAEAVAAAWTEATGSRVVGRYGQCLHRLERLRPQRSPPGRPRAADPSDAALLATWLRRFGAESGATVGAVETAVADRLTYRGWLLWEDAEGRPVSVAGLNRRAAGAIRIGPVYTPPDDRGRGFGSAVTVAATAAALDRGAHHVVLFTDVRNPTSNRLYRRLGFVPVEERVAIRFSRT